MSEPRHPTPYSDVNAVLHAFAEQLRSTLGGHFRGMYLSGSLALGDFDPGASDIDFVVVTEDALSADHVEALRDMHARFESSGSPWAGRVEAVYVSPEALNHRPISPASYPQVEKGGALFVAPLESGWIYHCYTLREHGVTVAGPRLRPLIKPVDPDDMRRAAAPVAGLWLHQSRHDPSWLAWIRSQDALAFVVLTLCRLLYTLDSGSVASKPAAALWARKELGPVGARWGELIERALAEQHSRAETSEGDRAAAIALVEHTVQQFQRWKSTLPPAP
jgi:hypothetical protein